MTPPETPDLLPVRYTKKPITIEAIQFSGKWEDALDIIEFTNGAAFPVNDLNFKRQYLHINTLEGVMTIAPKDWVIKGIKGEFYPCKPDIFEATYDRADLVTRTTSAPPDPQSDMVAVPREVLFKVSGALQCCGEYESGIVYSDLAKVKAAVDALQPYTKGE